MSDFYQILGVRSDATDIEIRAAFRGLAKQLHPDLNAGDVDAGRRLREVIHAYETLSDPALRMAYDANLAHWRSQQRLRLRSRAITMVTVFVLTVTVGLAWRPISKALRTGAGNSASAPPSAPGSTTGDAKTAAPDSAPTVAKVAPSPAPRREGPAGPHASPSPEAKETEDGRRPGASEPVRIMTPDDGASPARSEQAGAEPAADEDRVRRPGDARVQAFLMVAPGTAERWVSYADRRFGFALEYPEDIFAPDLSRSDADKTFRSRDGRATLQISASLTNGVALTAHRRALREGAYADAAFDYEPRRPNWYVLSGTLGTHMFYHRVTFSCDGRALHSWKLVYPLAEREHYDRIVEEVHRRYRRLPSGGCG
jgi:hypothetical protein